MNIRRSVFSIVITLIAAIFVVHAQPSEKLLIGVMRRDGVILPFASYDGSWSLPWPGSVRNMELPITLDAIPKKWWGGGPPPASWTLWPVDGSTSRPVTSSAPMAILVGVEKRLGVRSSFVSGEPLPLPLEVPYPKEGLAVAGAVKVEPIASVSRRVGAWRDFPTALKDDIDTAEQKVIDRVKASSKWSHPIGRPDRERIPAELEAWYTSSLVQPGFGVSYIEAVKKYPPEQEDQGCGLETFISGWVYSNTRVPRPKTDLTAKITYCDRNGVTYMLPLGILRVNNRTHWVFQLSSWETEWYAVAEATPGRMRYVVEYFGGGRPPRPEF